MTARPRSEPGEVASCLKRDGRCSVWRVHRTGAPERLVKRWRLTPALFFKLLAGQAQPQRQRRAAAHLARAGIRTPEVSRGPRLVSHPDTGVAIEIELPWVAGETALECLRRGLDDAEARRLGAACGALVHSIAATGRFNRDLKLSNLVVDPGGRVWMIDPVGVRRSADRVESTLRMLERLAVEPRDLGIALPRAAVIAAVRRALRGLPRRPARAAHRLRNTRPPG